MDFIIHLFHFLLLNFDIILRNFNFFFPLILPLFYDRIFAFCFLGVITVNPSIYIALGMIVALGALFFFLMRSADKHLNSMKTKPKRR